MQKKIDFGHQAATSIDPQKQQKIQIATVFFIIGGINMKFCTHFWNHQIIRFKKKFCQKVKNSPLFDLKGFFRPLKTTHFERQQFFLTYGYIFKNLISKRSEEQKRGSLWTMSWRNVNIRPVSGPLNLSNLSLACKYMP